MSEDERIIKVLIIDAFTTGYKSPAKTELASFEYAERHYKGVVEGLVKTILANKQK